MINNYIPSNSIFKQDLLKIYGDSNDGSAEKTSSNTGFSDILKSQLDKVNDAQINSDNTIQDYINGDATIQDTILATEEASMSLNLAIEMRNKLVDAYKEINNMQV